MPKSGLTISCYTHKNHFITANLNSVCQTMSMNIHSATLHTLKFQSFFANARLLRPRPEVCGVERNEAYRIVP